MKKSKSHAAEAMLLCGALALGVGMYTVAAKAAGETVPVPKESEEVIRVWDPGVSQEIIQQENARHFYLYGNGAGDYIKVEGIEDSQINWEELKDEEVEEIFLSAIKADADGNTYVYRDSNGTLVASLEIATEPSQLIPWGLKKYSIDWNLEKNEYARGSVELELTDIRKFHVYMSVTALEATYIGLYSTEHDRYIWLEVPIVSQEGRDYSFLMSSSSTYQFALKNSEALNNRYTGWYYITTGG